MSAAELSKLVELLTSRPAPLDTPLAAMRERFGKLAEFLPTPADATLEPVDAGGVPAEFVAAPGADPAATILYLHGGGYAIGSAATHRSLAYNLSAASGARALTVDYRLAPEHAYPAAVEDATAAYRWLLQHGGTPARTVIAGDSAGGGLAVATLLNLRGGRAAPLPAGGFCISPWTDLAGTGASIKTNATRDPMVEEARLHRYAGLYANGADLREPLASPLYGELAGLPPLLIHVGSSEILLDDAIRLAERAQAADVDVELEVAPNMVHIWHLFAPMLGEGRAAVARAGRWIRDRVGTA